jgi:hypothetical protein
MEYEETPSVLFLTEASIFASRGSDIRFLLIERDGDFDSMVVKTNAKMTGERHVRRIIGPQVHCCSFV